MQDDGPKADALLGDRGAGSWLEGRTAMPSEGRLRGAAQQDVDDEQKHVPQVSGRSTKNSGSWGKEKSGEGSRMRPARASAAKRALPDAARVHQGSGKAAARKSGSDLLGGDNVRLVIKMDREQHPYMRQAEGYVHYAELEAGWQGTGEASKTAEESMEAGLSNDRTEKKVEQRGGSIEYERFRRSEGSRSGAARSASADARETQEGIAQRRPFAPLSRALDSHAASSGDSARKDSRYGVPLTRVFYSDGVDGGRRPAAYRHDDENVGPDGALREQLGNELSLSDQLTPQLERLSALYTGGGLSEVEYTLAKQVVLDTCKNLLKRAELNRVRNKLLRSRAKSADAAKQKMTSTSKGSYSLLDPTRNSAPAALSHAVDTKGASSVAIYDVNRTRRAAEFLGKIRRRQPFTTHMYGESYENRYRLHPFSGYELAKLEACPSWSFGGGRKSLNWLGTQSSQIPGPGEYDILKVDQRMWVRPSPVFGKELQRPVSLFVDESDTKAKPSPQEYDVQMSWDAASTVFGKSLRGNVFEDQTKELLGIPGPGHYEVAVSWDANTAVFGTEEQRPEEPIERHAKHIPGPGQYPLPDDFARARGHVMGTGPREPVPTQQDKDRTEFPGPGTYDWEQGWISQSGIVFGTAEQRILSGQEKHWLSVPGAGEYRVEYGWDTPGPVFGTSARDICNARHVPNFITPGAGTYNVPADFGRGIATIFGTETQRQLGLDEKAWLGVPGVGAYNIQNDDRSGPAYPFGTASARAADVVLESKSSWPGPGRYEATEHVGHEGRPCKFGTEAQRPEAQKSIVPGVGQYDIANADAVVHEHGPRFKIGSEMQRPPEIMEKNGKKQPGPGEYVTTDEPGKPKAVTFTKAKRDTALSYSLVPDLPGPGAYEVRPHTATGSKFGQEQRWVDEDEEAKDLPGPGQYTVTAEEGLKITFSKGPRDLHLDIRHVKEVPGPGQYTLRKDLREEWEDTAGQRALGGSMGRTVKVTEIDELTQNKELVPGPGHYEAEHGHKAVWGAPRRHQIGKELQRPPSAQERNSMHVPGVGSYDVRESAASLMKEHKGVTFGREDARGMRFEEKEAGNTPSAADYSTLGTLLTGKGPTFPKQAARIPTAEERQWTENPGVGAYNVIEGKEVTFPQSGSAHMGTQERKLDVSVSNVSIPGPGAYDTAPAPTGVHVSFGKQAQRPLYPEDAWQQQVPGVGMYDAERFDQPVAFTLGKEAQRPLDAQSKSRLSVPGVGHYDVARMQHRGGPFSESGASIGTAEQRPLDPQSNARRWVPGPGEYHVGSLLSQGGAMSSQAISIGTSERSDIFTSASEGKEAFYDVLGMVARGGKIPSHAFTMGKTQSYDPEASRSALLPGVGEYHVETLTNRGPIATSSVGFPKAERETEGKAKDVPGPGQYDVAQKFTSQAATFGKSARPEDPSVKAASSYPGPGGYDVENLVAGGGHRPSRHVTFGRADRGLERDTSPKQSAPGPGWYDTRETKTLRGPVIGTEARLEYPWRLSEQEGPGPAMYDLRGVTRQGVEPERGPIFSGAGEARPNRREDEAPGPGVYQVRGTRTDGNRGNTSIATGLGLGNRSSVDLRAPGPGPGGEYDVPSTFGTHKGANLLGVGHMPLVSKEALSTPGPAAYEPQLQDSSPAVRFGHSSKALGSAFEMLEDLPGPGEYSIRGLGHVGGAFTVKGPVNFGVPGAARPSQREDQDTPGPATYYPLHPQSHSISTSFPMGEARTALEGERLEGPGPAAYDVASAYEASHRARKIAVPVMASSGARLEQEREDGVTPGPGHYETNTGMSQMLDKLYGGFARAPKMPADTDIHPGPGHYSYTPLVPSTTEGSLSGKTFEGTRLTGQGQTAAQHSSVLASSGGTLPGPGSYDLPEYKGGSAPKLYGADRHTTYLPHKLITQEKEYQSYPGPGQYSTEKHTGAATRIAKKTALPRRHARFLERYLGDDKRQGQREGHIDADQIYRTGFKQENTSSIATAASGSNYQTTPHFSAPPSLGQRTSTHATAQSGDVGFDTEKGVPHRALSPLSERLMSEDGAYGLDEYWRDRRGRGREFDYRREPEFDDYWRDRPDIGRGRHMEWDDYWPDSGGHTTGSDGTFDIWRSSTAGP